MAKIKIEIKGVGAELVLGNYMPKDPTIYKDWQEFYRYDDLIHESQLLSEHVNEILIIKDGEHFFSGQIQANQFKAEKSFCPAMEQNELYLRAECVENAVYACEFETKSFELSKLFFETQDYDTLFKVGKSFITSVLYENKKLELEWKNATPLGSICLLCKFENGYLVPIYDAINKVEAKK